MAGSDELVSFYEDAYGVDPVQGERFGRWRALGAAGKADHVIELCARAGVSPSSTLDVGCGDGALLSELRTRGFGGRLSGVEIARAAVEIARTRPGIDHVELYDGEHIDAADGAYGLGVLSHVLEHVRDPAQLLTETARACSAVVMEVPLEANWSARRSGKREHAHEVGHLQRLDRDAARAIVATAGLRVACELEDPLPRRVHRFFADSRAARLRADARWAVRSGAHRAAPALARATFTLHYACLCLPPAA